MSARSVTDRLREEYASLLPEIRRALLTLQTQVSHSLLDMALKLRPHERIQIEARIKDCESAIGALRRRQEGRSFDEQTPEKYSLRDLPDLAGVRVLVFPRTLCAAVDEELAPLHGGWDSDPVMTGSRENRKWRAYKYHGYTSAESPVRGELQIVPMLVGLFWHVEHDAFYKPEDPVLAGAVKRARVQAVTEAVYDAFDELESTLESELKKAGDRR